MYRCYWMIWLIFMFRPSHAIYDLAAIDIAPANGATRFCFTADTDAQKLFLALTPDAQEFLFLSPAADGSLSVSPWQYGTEPPALTTNRRRNPVCFGPYPDTLLNGVQLYAAAGNSLQDSLEKGQYQRIFAGFPVPGEELREWTVMVYMIGSTLEKTTGGIRLPVVKGYGSQDLVEMIHGTAASAGGPYHAVVATGGSTREGWKSLKYAQVRDGQLYPLQDFGTQDMSNPAVLSDFVTWSAARFPARHYALILWDHGGGTQGYGQDTSPGGSDEMLDLAELRQAYRNIYTNLGKKLDLIVYDACLMGTIEVAEVTATAAHVMAASAELEPAHGQDYAYLFSHLASAPADGLALGQILKVGYISHTQAQGTFDSSQITYSLFDLSKLAAFTRTFEDLAADFKTLLSQGGFTAYEGIGQGLINAPSYPLRAAGRFSTLDLGQRFGLSDKHVRVDLYALLENLAAKLPSLQVKVTASQAALEQLVPDFATNHKVAALDPQAGRLSINIGLADTEYLQVLPQAYSVLQEGLQLYDEKKRQDTFTPDSSFTCATGFTCAFAQWLELDAEAVSGVEVYYGQKSGDALDVYLVEPDFYRNRGLLDADLRLPVDAAKACAYQVCNESDECRPLTLRNQAGQLLADVLVNEIPAILTFCPAPAEAWELCGVAAQTGNLWERGESGLYPGDSMRASTLHLQDNTLQPGQSAALTLGAQGILHIRKTCDNALGAVSAAAYSLNGARTFNLLCDRGDCVCMPGDNDPGCVELGAKAGIYLKNAH